MSGSERTSASWFLTWPVVFSMSCAASAGASRAGAAQLEASQPEASQPEASQPEASRPTELVFTQLGGPPCAPLSAQGDGDEVAESLQRCPGLAGYQLLVLDADSRVTVSVVGPGGEHFPLEYGRVISPHFSQLGQAAIWWQGVSGLALAVPVLANEDVDDPEQVSHYWAIAKVARSGACVTERLAAGALETGSAERVKAALAVAPQRPCLVPLSASRQ